MYVTRLNILSVCKLNDKRVFHLCPVVTYDLGAAISEGMDVATQLAFEMELVGNLSY